MSKLDVKTLPTQLRALADSIENNPAKFESLTASLQQAHTAASAIAHPGIVQPRDVDWGYVGYVGMILLLL